jgi:serine/threonine-protein kinase HipA
MALVDALRTFSAPAPCTSALDRLAYMGDRGMGAFEYHPKIEDQVLTGPLDMAELFKASQEIWKGETTEVLTQLRLAGGSLGGARPKVVVADEPIETDAIEYAYAQMARDAGVFVAETTLLNPLMPSGNLEQFFASKRFDRESGKKIHMLTVSALLYADFRAPTMDYSDTLKLAKQLARAQQRIDSLAGNRKAQGKTQ